MGAPELAIKICGVTRESDLLACAEQGIDAVGLNLWPKSKRALSLSQAQALIRSWPRAQPQRPAPMRVGVFVDPMPADVMRAYDRLELDLVQYHGELSPYLHLGLPYIWVIRGTPALAELRIPEKAPRLVLLDAAVAGYGGAGTTTDWQWAARAVQHLAPLPVWLAGGLHRDNLGAALREVMPAGVDIASGAERPGATHGEKDVAAITAMAAEVAKERARRSEHATS